MGRRVIDEPKVPTSIALTSTQRTKAEKLRRVENLRSLSEVFTTALDWYEQEVKNRRTLARGAR